MEEALKKALGNRPVQGVIAPQITPQAPNDGRVDAIAKRLLEVKANWDKAAATAKWRAMGAAGGNQAAPKAPAQWGANAEVHLRENRTVRQLRGSALAAAERGAPGALGALSKQDLLERTARKFFSANQELLQLNDAAAELRLERRDEDVREGRLRFQQQYRGLAVWPASLTAHFDADERLTCLSGAYVSTPNIANLVPRIRAQDAAAIAHARLPAEWRATNTEPELIIYGPVDAESRLAWKFDVTAGLERAWRIVIDAQDGRVLHQLTRVFETGAAGSGVDLTGTSRALNIWQAGNTYYLLDTSKAMFNAQADPVTDPRGVITIGDARNTPIDQVNEMFLVTSTSAGSWLIPDAVSAAFNFSETYDYFRAEHNRNSLDDAGGNITAIVRIGKYDNASWNGNLSLMIFGDAKPFAASLDVVGHELSHGITEKTAGLIYQDQSGALNEAFSDIFGEMVEARSRGVNDWLMGSELGGAFRNMKNPGALQIAGLDRPFPSKMSDFINLPNTDQTDHGGVHLNSSIINHCFYQLAEGMPEAIGRTAAARIFYRTLTAHLQPQSRFVDCRLGAIASAETLFGVGSTEARSTAKAFDLVEIFAAPTTPEPTPVPVVQSPDSTLFIYEDFFSFNLGRRESAQSDQAAGSIFALDIKKQRPAVTGDGSVVMMVSADNDLCAAETADPNSLECLGFAGSVHSAAIAPNGKLAAFVLRNALTGEPEGSVTVIDFDSGESRTYTLIAPALDASAVDQVLFADAMAFSTDSTKLIYDALSRVRFSSGPALDRWSIYALDLATERTEIIVPPLDGLNTGNPAPGRAGSRFIAFDAEVVASGAFGVVVLDLFTGDFQLAAETGDSPGYPSFTGDESSVIFAAPNGNNFGSGISLFEQALSSDRLEKVGLPMEWQSEALLGVVYRRGTFTGTNALPVVTLAAIAGQLSAPATITLSAAASDSDGSITRVEFFNGAEKIGEVSAPSNDAYRFEWSNVAAGNYRVTARAIDNLGGASDSVAQEARVMAAGTLSIAGTRIAAGDIRMELQAPTGSYILQRSRNLTQWTDLQPLEIGAAGILTVTDPLEGGSGYYFYRLRTP